MRKTLKTMMAGVTLSAMLSFPAAAATVYKNTLQLSPAMNVITTTPQEGTSHAADPSGRWVWSEKGWWWYNSDGTFPYNTWAFLDGNKDGVAECYYFQPDGYILINGTAPNGCVVNAQGQWLLNGIVYTKKTADIGTQVYSYTDTATDIVTQFYNTDDGTTSSSSSSSKTKTIRDLTKMLEALGTLSDDQIDAIKTLDQYYRDND